jgi:carbamoyltransferase
MHIGIKYTHDASVTGIDGGRLIFHHEMEKVESRRRYTTMLDPSWVDQVLEREGVKHADIRRIAVDGWKNGRALHLEVAPYTDDDAGGAFTQVERLWVEGDISPRLRGAPYVSFTHEMGHLVGAYAMSPFSQDGGSAFVVAWDGGMTCRAYRGHARGMIFLGTVLNLSASIYSDMGLFWGPFKDQGPSKEGYGRMEWPGKLMSWISRGRVYEPIVARIDEAHRLFVPTERQGVIRGETRFLQYAKNRIDGFADDADVLRSIHEWLKRKLIQGIERLWPAGMPIVLVGGAFLNIKWNTAIRNHFGEVFVPPTPNDSGSSIGAAVLASGDKWHLHWDAFSGPHMRDSSCPPGWRRVAHRDPTGRRYVAIKLLEYPERPVLVLAGRAEIGPRALGARSLIMAATSPRGRAVLNEIKGREDFRPVAPICLEERAREIFWPGTEDRHMLFDHQVRPDWMHKVPAVVHDDRSARLQTVPPFGSPIRDILHDYCEMTSIPVLCNTSANLSGSGFFDSTMDAAVWAADRGIATIVTEDDVYEKL